MDLLKLANAANLDPDQLREVSDAVNKVTEALEDPEQRESIKLAGFFANVGGHVSKAAPAMAAAASIAVAGILAEKLVSMGINSVSKLMSAGPHYNKMLELHPDLKRGDQAKTRMLFNTVSNLSPTIAADPYAVGNVVKHLSQFEGMGLDSMSRLVDIESKRSGKQHENPVTKAMLGTLAASSKGGSGSRDSGERITQNFYGVKDRD